MAKAKKKTAKKKVSKKKAVVKKKTLAERLKSAKRDLDNLRNKSVRSGKKLFEECVVELFKNNPTLERFEWPQYTPHWNDGDECSFSTYFDSLKVNEEEEAECLYTLEHLNDLLQNKAKSETRIVLELSDPQKDPWEIESLKSDLKSIKTRNLQEVADKYKIKKSIHELLTSIDDSVYEDMFGEGLVVVTRHGTNVEDYEHD